jgi:hypothetical protein
LFILVYDLGSYGSEDSDCGLLDYDILVCCMDSNVSGKHTGSMFRVEVTIVPSNICTLLRNVKTSLLDHMIS